MRASWENAAAAARAVAARSRVSAAGMPAASADAGFSADIDGSPALGTRAGRGAGMGQGRVQQNKEIPALAVGDAVQHRTFGRGRVIGVEGAGDKTVAKVRFGADEKRLLLRYAPLEKVEG